MPAYHELLYRAALSRKARMPESPLETVSVKASCFGLLETTARTACWTPRGWNLPRVSGACCRIWLGRGNRRENRCTG